MTKVYKTSCWGEKFEISANFAEALSPVHGVGGGLQVADFRHSSWAAMRAALEEFAVSCGDDPEDEEIAEEITKALAAMEYES